MSGFIGRMKQTFVVVNYAIKGSQTSDVSAKRCILTDESNHQVLPLVVSRNVLHGKSNYK